MELIKTFLSKNKNNDLICNEVYFNYTLKKYQLFNCFVDKNILDETWIERDKLSNYADLDLAKINMNDYLDILNVYQSLISYYGFINFGCDMSYDYIILSESRVNKIKEKTICNYCKVVSIGYN